MTTRLVFTVPYAGREILAIVSEGRVAGVTYDPLSTSAPTTWVAGCERCLTLRDRRVPLKVRRAVRCLSTLRLTTKGFTARVVTGTEYTHVVRARRHQGEWVLSVRCRGNETLAPLEVTGSDSRVTGGRPRDYRSPVLRLTLRVLLSAREPSEREVQAILSGLPGEAPPRRHSHDAELVRLTGYARVLTPTRALREGE